MILLEGIDGSGKTTLAKAICEKFGLGIGRRATNDRDLLYTVTRQDTYTALGHCANPSEPAQVYDRLYYSELIYAHIVGRPCEFSPSEQMWVERMIEATHCPVILCRPPFAAVEANAHATHQMRGVNEHLEQIYDDYNALYEDERFPAGTIVYDYTGSDPKACASVPEVFEEIGGYLDERTEREWGDV
jgi:tRNA uridine 5-carbamoylmethylation protein Kti12